MAWFVPRVLLFSLCIGCEIIFLVCCVWLVKMSVSIHLCNVAREISAHVLHSIAILTLQNEFLTLSCDQCISRCTVPLPFLHVSHLFIISKVPGACLEVAVTTSKGKNLHSYNKTCFPVLCRPLCSIMIIIICHGTSNSSWPINYKDN